MKTLTFQPAVYFLVLFALSSCTLREEITFRQIENVRFESLSVDGKVTLRADAVFHNPNDFAVLIKRTDTSVRIDEREVSAVRQDVGAEMAARSDFRLPLAIEIPAKSLFEGDLGAIWGGLLKNKIVVVKFDGAAVVDILGVDLTIPFTHEEEKGLKL